MPSYWWFLSKCGMIILSVYVSYMAFVTHPITDRYVSIFAVINDTAKKRGGECSYLFRTISFILHTKSRSRFTGKHSSTFKCLRCLNIILHISYTTLNFASSVQGSTFSTPSSVLSCCWFGHLASLTDMTVYLLVVLICMSLTISGTEDLFTFAFFGGKPMQVLRIFWILSCATEFCSPYSQN